MATKAASRLATLSRVVHPAKRSLGLRRMSQQQVQASGKGDDERDDRSIERFRRDPFRDPMDMMRDPARMMRSMLSPRLYQDLEQELSEMSERLDKAFGDSFAPMRVEVDVKEHNDRFELNADLPGMRREDLKVQLEENNTLVLSGQRTFEREGEGDLRRNERAYGRFERRFKLPSEVDGSGIKATMKEGVLNVQIPKAEEKRNVVNIDIAQED